MTASCCAGHKTRIILIYICTLEWQIDGFHSDISWSRVTGQHSPSRHHAKQLATFSFLNLGWWVEMISDETTINPQSGCNIFLWVWLLQVFGAICADYYQNYRCPDTNDVLPTYQTIILSYTPTQSIISWIWIVMPIKTKFAFYLSVCGVYSNQFRPYLLYKE